MSRIEDIPENYLSGIIIIANTDIGIIKTLKNSLDELREYSYPHHIADEVSKNFNFLKKNEIIDILYAVGSLTSLEGDPQDPITSDEIINDISDIIENENIEGIEKNIVNIKEFKEKLKLLLETDSIIYSFKSNDLLATNKNSIIFARIVSDIRPVFGENVEDSPKAATIVHNLNIHYSIGEHKRHDDFFVALDSNDLQYLKDVVDRAEKKDKSLKAILKDTTIRLFNTSERIK
jgi:hypothetical protein